MCAPWCTFLQPNATFGGNIYVKKRICKKIQCKKIKCKKIKCKKIIGKQGNVNCDFLIDYNLNTSEKCIK